MKTGTEVLNSLLGGGYDSNIINTIYGPAASGKTTCALLAAIAVGEKKGKTIFVDSENGFSVERLKQLTPNYKQILESIFLIKVNSFQEQTKTIKEINNLVSKTKIDLLIVDTIGAHYRNVLKSNVYGVNKIMDIQLDILNKIAKTHNTTILICNQVYTSLITKKITIVGGDMLSSWSKCLIEFENLHGPKRIARLIKHPNLSKKEIVFEIIENGFTLL